MQTATAQFSIDLTPAEPLINGSGRFDFAKTWTGDLSGASRGVMLSAGDPQTGNAGYVAIEVFAGSLGERSGGFALQQAGMMNDGEAELIYAITPGSGTDGLEGITGALTIEIVDGVHHVRMQYLL